MVFDIYSCLSLEVRRITYKPAPDVFIFLTEIFLVFNLSPCQFETLCSGFQHYSIRVFSVALISVLSHALLDRQSLQASCVFINRASIFIPNSLRKTATKIRISPSRFPTHLISRSQHFRREPYFCPFLPNAPII